MDQEIFTRIFCQLTVLFNSAYIWFAFQSHNIIIFSLSPFLLLCEASLSLLTVGVGKGQA